jgi:hypothetical protein
MTMKQNKVFNVNASRKLTNGHPRLHHGKFFEIVLRRDSRARLRTKCAIFPHLFLRTCLRLGKLGKLLSSIARRRVLAILDMCAHG